MDGTDDGGLLLQRERECLLDRILVACKLLELEATVETLPGKLGRVVRGAGGEQLAAVWHEWDASACMVRLRCEADLVIAVVLEPVAA